ncbi:MAG: YfhO family protein, partial [Parasporobacterium sp.]|nr:YfhO family protein [Parasporobacterium sp.]
MNSAKTVNYPIGRQKGFIRYNLPVILAFIIPVLILLLLYVGRSVFPFGENMFLRSDMYHQYAPFMKEFQRNLQQGGSMLYSWDIGLGTNFISTYSYYLASPANWLVCLFPDTLIPEFMNLMIILKSGAMSAVFAWYLRKKFRKNDISLTAFGCFYAMSAYMAAFSWNVMWLDCLILLPLIMRGLESLVKEGRVRLYTISLAVCIFSNYYISIMICIFLVFYFIYLLICEKRNRSVRACLRSFLNFAFYSVIAGCAAMVVVLPALYNLFITASSGSAFPRKFTAYYNILELVAKSVINTEPAVFSGHFPNIYSTMALFVLVPAYWMSKKIPAMQKAGKTVLVCLLAFSFMFNIPTYIWHGFHFPNSLPCRYSFIYILLVLTMGYEAFLNIRRFRTGTLVLCAVGSTAAVFLLQKLYPDTITVENACLAGAFILLYLLIAAMLRSTRLPRIATLIMLVVVASAEILINTNNTGYSTTSRTIYMSDNEALQKMLGRTDDGQFYRVEKVKRRTKNDGAWLDYRSASIFSSTAVAGNSDLYTVLGMQGKTNSYSYYGHT